MTRNIVEGNERVRTTRSTVDGNGVGVRDTVERNGMNPRVTVQQRHQQERGGGGAIAASFVLNGCGGLGAGGFGGGGF